ncbi:MAG: hypothetical protein HC838_13605 [Spirulinaceae cyanobacterium RM2_2_10]|nr:hypothetical protein [Spirulinaceae cyanobacterium RM2_2_10]
MHDLWAVIVDLVCASFILWIASGLLIWWRSGQPRAWGLVALGAGVLSFVGLLAWL